MTITTETPELAEHHLDHSDRLFQISSISDANTFEEYINSYYINIARQQGKGLIPSNYISRAFIYSQNHPSGGRLMNAIVDLELIHLFMYKDSHIAGGTWNNLSSLNLSNKPILTDITSFSSRVDILYVLNSFALRCRAFWDKYMGLLVLLCDESKYDIYCGSRSKKRTFKKMAENWTNLPKSIRLATIDITKLLMITLKSERNFSKELELEILSVPKCSVDLIDFIITSLDSLRTPEDHGAGTLRKSILSTMSVDVSKGFQLLHHWNFSIYYVKSLRQTITDSVEVEERRTHLS